MGFRTITPSSVVAVTAVVVAIALIAGGAYVLLQIGDLAVNLKRLNAQLSTFEGMNKQLDDMNAKLTTMNAALLKSNAELTRTREVLEGMAVDIGKMTEKIGKAKLLF